MFYGIKINIIWATSWENLLMPYVTGRPCGSVAQWSECSRGMWEVLGSSPGRAMCFFLPCDIWWPVWVCAWAASSKGAVWSVQAWFRADFETNLIKQGEIVTGRPCCSVAQWSECWHGMREVLGSSPGRAMWFFLPCDTYADNKGAAHDYHLDYHQYTILMLRFSCHVSWKWLN